MRTILHLVTVAALAFVTLSTSACGQTAKTVTVEEAKAMIDKNTKIVVLDVRTPGEWNSGHLKNAKHADIQSSDFEQKIASIDKNATVVVYCAAGGRSSRAASIMVQKGYKDVINMAGGINAWNAAGYPTTK